MHTFEYLPIDKVFDFPAGFNLIMIQNPCPLQTLHMDVQDFFDIVKIDHVNDVLLTQGHCLLWLELLSL